MNTTDSDRFSYFRPDWTNKTIGRYLAVLRPIVGEVPSRVCLQRIRMDSEVTNTVVIPAKNGSRIATTTVIK